MGRERARSVETEVADRRLSQQERLSALMDALAQGETVSSNEVARRFGVSVATARRDLNALSTQRLVTRTHGGALAPNAAYELPLHYRAGRSASGQVAIAEAAAALVASGQVVGLTGGTTTTEVARALGRSTMLDRAGSAPSATIVTNALNIAYEMAIRPHLRVMCTGGVARAQTFELIGPLVAESLDRLHLDWAFIGVDGLSASHGATTHHEGEAAANLHLALRADRVVVVADHSKLGAAAFARVFDLDRIDVLVTDRRPPLDHADAFKGAGIEVIVAS